MAEYVLWILLGLAAAIVVGQFGWCWASRHWQLPCPTLLAWMVDGPMVDRFSGTEQTLARLGLQPGKTVVEIGPGPGRLLLPAARRVLPGGRAIGIELQQGMIDKLRKKLSRDDPGNVELIHADATQSVLPPESVDVVYLCTVLGEIPDRAVALKNCYDALRPGGMLSITEIVLDPHYQTVKSVRDLAATVGFTFEDMTSTWRMYTANFHKP